MQKPKLFWGGRMAFKGADSPDAPPPPPPPPVPTQAIENLSKMKAVQRRRAARGYQSTLLTTGLPVGTQQTLLSSLLGEQGYTGGRFLQR